MKVTSLCKTRATKRIVYLAFKTEVVTIKIISKVECKVNIFQIGYHQLMNFNQIFLL